MALQATNQAKRAGFPSTGITPFYAIKPTGLPLDFIDIAKVDRSVIGSDRAGHVVSGNAVAINLVIIAFNLDCPPA